MARVADSDADAQLEEVPSKPVFRHDASLNVTIKVTQNDLRCICTLAVRHINENPNATAGMVLSDGLFGQCDMVKTAYETASNECSRRDDLGINPIRETTIKLDTDEVEAILMTLREIGEELDGVRGRDMAKLSEKISNQTGYENPM